MASRSETHVWADKELSRLLSSEYVEAVTDYILLIEDDKEVNNLADFVFFHFSYPCLFYFFLE